MIATILLILLVASNLMWFQVFRGYREGVTKAINKHMQEEHYD